MEDPSQINRNEKKKVNIENSSKEWRAKKNDKGAGKRKKFKDQDLARSISNAR